MLRKAFDFAPGHRTRDLASLSLVFPSYRMTWAETDAPATMVVGAVADAAVAVQCLHFAAVVGDAARDARDVD